MAIQRESAPQKNNTATNHRAVSNSQNARPSCVANSNQPYRPTSPNLNISLQEDSLGYGRKIRLVTAAPKVEEII
jgi:hypothetical protein